jgi:hypothetical protein
MLTLWGLSSIPLRLEFTDYGEHMSLLQIAHTAHYGAVL